MNAIGQIEIEPGLTLHNPSLDIITVRYDWVNHIADVECIFKEENATFEHSRTFSFNTDYSGELTTDDIIMFINEHPVLNVFS